MGGLLSGVKASAREIARAAAFSAAFGLAGLILILIGLGCFTAAIWLVIATHQGAVFAFAFIGITYLALGAVCLAFAARPPRGRGRLPQADARPPREPLVQIAEGFALGMQAGRAARRPRR